MKLAVVSITGAMAVAAGCAPQPGNVQPEYTSAALYETLSCQQLYVEALNVSNNAHDAVNLQRRHRTQDTVAVAAGALVFWPALFFVHGSDANTARLAHLRGEMEAIEQASRVKNCGFVFDRV